MKNLLAMNKLEFCPCAQAHTFLIFSDVVAAPVHLAISSGYVEVDLPSCCCLCSRLCCCNGCELTLVLVFMIGDDVDDFHLSTKQDFYFRLSLGLCLSCFASWCVSFDHSRMLHGP